MQLKPTGKSTRSLAMALGIAAAGSVLPLSSSLLAQDAARVEAGLKVWRSGGCSGCHGDFAEGGPGGEQPAGPSIRRTRLTREQLVETIGCGRPGSGMPANLAGAYTKISCYGLPVGEAPANMVFSASFSPEQLEALGDYLMARIVGKGAVTRAECAAYFGAEASLFCTKY